MPKTAPQFFRFKAKEIADRKRQQREGRTGAQLKSRQTGEPVKFRPNPKEEVKRAEPEFYGPYKKRPSKSNPAPTILRVVPASPQVAEPSPVSMPVQVKLPIGTFFKESMKSTANILFAGLAAAAVLSIIKASA